MNDQQLRFLMTYRIKPAIAQGVLLPTLHSMLAEGQILSWSDDGVRIIVVFADAQTVKIERC